MRKTVTAAAMAASLTIGGVAGAALFAPTLSGAETDVPPIEDTVEAGDDRHHPFLDDAVAPLVEDGTITQDQADAVIDAIHDARPLSRVIGHHFPFGSALTDLLGIDPAQLRDALAEGQTIAELAEAGGVSVDEVVAALVAEAEERLDGAVADGRLSQAEADERLAAITERISAVVEGEAPFAGDMHRGHRGWSGPGR